MSSAVLEVESSILTLKSGIYLIRGPGVKNAKAEHSLRIDNESIDDKHAIIVVETDGIFIYDLDTSMGTFVNEQRLAALSKFGISEDVSIRFGAVEGKLKKCSTLEQHHSSGFHDESLRLVLDQTNDAENLTIPETQCVSPEECIYACEAKENKNVSNISIPETQELQFPTTSTSASTPQVENVETSLKKDTHDSQFCISTQEFNDGLCETLDSNSRDFLEDINWLMNDEQTTAIKQTAKCTVAEETLQTKIDESNNAGEVQNQDETPHVEMDAEQTELLRSQTHTPDLFDDALLQEFEKKESRLIKARSMRAQKENVAAKGTEVESNMGIASEERTQTASEKSIVDKPPDEQEDITSKASIPTPVSVRDDQVKDNIASEQSLSESTGRKGKIVEIDLFEGRILENDELNGVFAMPPLQHSNKENMIAGVETLGDLEPTQVFVSKKGMKPPEVVPTKSTTSSYGLLASDFEPTQAFKKKKAKDGTQTTKAPVDENDLVPTQKFVPKTSSKSGSNTNKAITFNSTMVQSSQNEHPKQSVTSFFAEVDVSQQVEEKSSNASTSKAILLSPMLTPEIISKAFDGQKVPDTESRLQLLRKLDFDSEGEDPLTRLLTNPRNRTDFDSLIESIKKAEENQSQQRHEEQSDILEKYIDSKTGETPQKERKLEKKPAQLKNNEEPIAQTSPKRARSKRKGTEEPDTKEKRKKVEQDKGQSLANNNKNTLSDDKKLEDNKKTNENKVRRGLRKRAATADEASKNNPTDTVEPSSSNTVTEKTTGDLTHQSVDSLKEKEPQSNKRAGSRERKTSNSSSSSTVTKASSRSNSSGRVKKIAKTETESVVKRTSSRLRTQSNTSVHSVEETNKSDNEKHSQTTKSSASSKNTKLETIQSSPDITANDGGTNSKKSRSHKERKNSNQKAPSDDSKSTLNPSILPVKRTRSRATSTVVSSQTAEPEIEKADEKPTTSKAAKKNLAIDGTKSVKKNVLKLAFTMIEPEKKDELLKHTSNKWVEAKDITESEVLVMDIGNRTLKFLIAVAKGIPIVTSKWLEAIKDSGVVSIRPQYFFKDAAFERSFKFSLLQTLNKAKNVKLFTDFQFLITNNIVPGPDDMKMIITCAGGTILEKEDIPHQAEGQQLYLISSDKDRQHWHSYRRKNAHICITSTEAVMLAVMRYDFEILKRRSF